MPDKIAWLIEFPDSSPSRKYLKTMTSKEGLVLTDSALDAFHFNSKEVAKVTTDTTVFKMLAGQRDYEIYEYLFVAVGGENETTN